MEWIGYRSLTATTFCLIVDRFIELNNIDVSKVEYTKRELFGYDFTDEQLSDNFREYHKDIAVLRIVRKERNSSIAYQARITKQEKDLSIV